MISPLTPPTAEDVPSRWSPPPGRRPAPLRLPWAARAPRAFPWRPKPPRAGASHAGWTPAGRPGARLTIASSTRVFGAARRRELHGESARRVAHAQCCEARMRSRKGAYPNFSPDSAIGTAHAWSWCGLEGSMKKHVMVVDDDPSLCTILDAELTKRDYRTTLAQSPTEALALLDAGDDDVDVILTDFQM